MLKLKPHHIVDIIRDYGQGLPFNPHPYGHHYHLLANQIIADVNREVQLVVSWDDICAPCRHLNKQGLCDDILPNHPYSNSKQEYNSYLDTELMKFLLLQPGETISIAVYLKKILTNLAFFDTLYPHPKEIIAQRKIAFQKGAEKLGIL